MQRYKVQGVGFLCRQAPWVQQWSSKLLTVVAGAAQRYLSTYIVCRLSNTTLDLQQNQQNDLLHICNLSAVQLLHGKGADVYTSQLCLQSSETATATQSPALHLIDSQARKTKIAGLPLTPTTYQETKSKDKNV